MAIRILAPACAVVPENSAPKMVLLRVAACACQRDETSQHLRPLEKLARRRGFKLSCGPQSAQVMVFAGQVFCMEVKHQLGHDPVQSSTLHSYFKSAQRLEGQSANVILAGLLKSLSFDLEGDLSFIERILAMNGFFVCSVGVGRASSNFVI